MSGLTWRNTADAAIAQNRFAETNEAMKDAWFNVQLEDTTEQLSNSSAQFSRRDQDEDDEPPPLLLSNAPSEPLQPRDSSQQYRSLQPNVQQRRGTRALGPVSGPEDLLREPASSRFVSVESEALSELERLCKLLNIELGRGASAGRGAGAELDSAVDQDTDSIYQNIWTYAAIALVLSWLSLATPTLTFFQLFTFYLVVFVFITFSKGFLSNVQIQYQRAVIAASKLPIPVGAYARRVVPPPSKPLLATAVAITLLAFGLFAFAFVTTLMSRVSPLLRENGLSLTALVRLMIIPALIMGTGGFFRFLRSHELPQHTAQKPDPGLPRST